MAIKETISFLNVAILEFPVKPGTEARLRLNKPIKEYNAGQLLEVEIGQDEIFATGKIRSLLKGEEINGACISSKIPGVKKTLRLVPENK